MEQTNTTEPSADNMTPLGRFGKLPPELRRDIFDLVFEDIFSGRENDFVGPNAVNPNLQAPVLDTSKAIRAEAMQSYLRRVEVMVKVAKRVGDELRSEVVRYGAPADFPCRPGSIKAWVKQNVDNCLQRVQRWRQAELRKMWKLKCMTFQEYAMAFQKE